MSRTSRPDNKRRRLMTVAVVVATAAGPMWWGASTASAATVTVCPSGCAYTQVSAAVAAASSGSTVQVGAGTYRGGFSITKNLVVVGSGAGRTVISGGGPVITIGTAEATTEPSVVLRGLTITGGKTRSTVGVEYRALGGGILIPASAGDGLGATLTVENSAITRNRAEPAYSEDTGVKCTAHSDCRFAWAAGGGIYSRGNLTVEHSVVSDNESTGRSSDADGAGIYAAQGAVVISDSVIKGNRALASRKIGRYAEGAGIMVDREFFGSTLPTSLHISNTSVTDNVSRVVSSYPAAAAGVRVDMLANAGGIHIGDQIPTTVADVSLTHDRATALDAHGEPTAVDPAMIVGDSPLTMRDTAITDNRGVTVSTTTDNAYGPTGGVLELDGPGSISGLTLARNVTVATERGGVAGSIGALAVFNFSNDPKLVTVSDSAIDHNVTSAFAGSGSAQVTGAGVINNSLLSMRNVRVFGNAGHAYGASGSAQGAGIWNGMDLSGPPVRLTLHGVRVTGNSLTGSSSISLQGGGLYTTTPVTLVGSRITGNRPSQCFGCS